MTVWRVCGVQCGRMGCVECGVGCLWWDGVGRLWGGTAAAKEYIGGVEYVHCVVWPAVWWCVCVSVGECVSVSVCVLVCVSVCVGVCVSVCGCVWVCVGVWVCV